MMKKIPCGKTGEFNFFRPCMKYYFSFHSDDYGLDEDSSLIHKMAAAHASNMSVEAGGSRQGTLEWLQERR